MGLYDTGKELLAKGAQALGLKESDPDKGASEQCSEFVEKMYRQAQGTLGPLHRLMYQDILWVLGEHYMEFNPNPSIRRFVLRPERSYIPRAISNLVIDYAERAVSFLSKANVVGRVVPEGVSSVDYSKAQSAERIRDRMWKDDLMEQKLRISNSWCVYTGNAIFLTDLDATNKPAIQIPEMAEIQVLDPDTGQPMFDESTGEPITTQEQTGKIAKTVTLSEVSSTPINPMRIVPDPYAENPWDLRYWLDHCAEDIDALADTFGSKAKALKPDKGVTTDAYYQNKVTDLVTRAAQGSGTYGLTSSVVEAPMDNAAIRKTFYRLPCSKYPKGEMLVKAGDTLLHYGEYPWINGEGKAYRNIHWYGWSLVPGCLWRFSMIRNLKDPQKRLNGMLTQAGLIRKTMGNPQWLAPRGCAFDDEGTSRPGKVNLWTPKPKLRGAKPERQDAAEIPESLKWELEVTVAHMDRISGENDVLRGDNPPGVDAKISLEFLAERASGRYEPAVKEMRQEIKTMEEFRLFLVRKSPAWAYGKRLYIRDEDGVAQVVELVNTDAPENPYIEMEASTTLLWSNAAKKQNVGQMLEAGVIDLTQPQNVRKLKQLFNASEFEDKQSPDVKLAEHENQLMLQGIPAETNEFENPEIHLPIHRRVLLRPDFKQFPPEAQQAFLAHFAATQEGMRQLAMTQQEAMEPPPQMPPEGGAPGQTGEEPGGEAPPMEAQQ